MLTALFLQQLPLPKRGCVYKVALEDTNVASRQILSGGVYGSRAEDRTYESVLPAATNTVLKLRMSEWRESGGCCGRDGVESKRRSGNVLTGICRRSSFLPNFETRTQKGLPVHSLMDAFHIPTARQSI